MIRTAKARERDAARQAAQWFARLLSPQQDEGVRVAWQQWFEACPENRQAWTKVEAVQRCFADVSCKQVAMATLQGTDSGRRRILRLAVAGATCLPLGMLAMQAPQAWRRWNAEFSTAVGQISRLPLRDGTVAVLDTDSAADVVYDEGASRILLRNGRVYVNAAGERGNASLAVVVQTEFGDVHAAGAEFVVCVGDRQGQVRVNTQAVRVVPRDGRAGARQVDAHQWADFSATEVGAPRHVDSEWFAAWRTGSLVAVKMPLGQFVARLRAYRPGWLLLDDSLAELPVSGTFPLANADLALDALENSYPVEIRRMTRYVTWIVPRAKGPARSV